MNMKYNGNICALDRSQTQKGRIYDVIRVFHQSPQADQGQLHLLSELHQVQCS